MRKNDNVLCLDEMYQNWVVLCMKHLLITHDIMSISEAVSQYQNEEEEEEQPQQQ